MQNFVMGLIARLMCCRSNKVEAEDEMIGDISSEAELSGSRHAQTQTEGVFAYKIEGGLCEVGNL